MHFPRRGTAKKTVYLFSSLCALFFCVYLGGILPLHHHDDGQEHDNCVLCIAQAAPLVVTGIFFIAVFVAAWTELLVVSFSATCFRHHPCYRGRAPPTLSA